MEINYQETSKDLLVRIDIHEKYGSANIDQWTNELLNPQAGVNILDVGCGAGKLSFLFDDYTKGGAKITGGDFSEEVCSTFYPMNRSMSKQTVGNNERELSFGSYHPGGCMMQLADGSVRFVSQTIDLTVWRAVGSRNGGETAQLD